MRTPGMRVLFLSNYYPPFEVGGYEQLCAQIAERFALRGHSVAVLTTTPAPWGEVVIDTNVHRALTLEVDWRLPRSAAYQFFVGRKGRERENLDHLDGLVQSFRPDVIFVWNVRGLHKSLLRRVENLPGVAVAYWLAGYYPDEPSQFEAYWGTHSARWYKAWPKKLLGKIAWKTLQSEQDGHSLEMKHVMCVSKAEMEKMIGLGLKSANTSVVYNGIELEKFAFKGPSPGSVGQGGRSLSLLYAGRLSAEKGVHTLVEAMSLLVYRHKLESVRLAICGKGTPRYESDLRDLVCEREIGSHVEFRGWVPREQMPNVLCQHDVFLFPSTEEALPRAVQEAMACGLVVVGTQAGGLKEILFDGENGLVFAEEDPEDLAVKINSLVEDRAMLCRLARAGRQTVVDKFDIERMVDEMETYLGSLAACP